MNSAVNASAAQQGRVRRVHNGVSGFVGDVSHHQFKGGFGADSISHAGRHYLSVSASTPGSFLPSRNSSDAPPPVEICVILLARPDWWTAATESPPPTIEIAPRFPATASAIFMVPRANGATSNTPMGPFHTIVRAAAISLLKAVIVSGPMSRPI